MQLLFTLIEDNKRTFFEVLKEALLHDIGDFVQKPSEVAMTVVVIQNPSQSLINPEDEVMQVVLVTCIVDVKLLADFSKEGSIVEQVIEGVCNLLNVEVDVALIVLVSGRMKDVVPSLSFLAEDNDKSIEIFD